MKALLPLLVAVTCFPLAAAAQQDQDGRGDALGTAEDIDRNESPVLVEPAPSGTEDEETLQTERESLVQISGTWATDQAACANTQAEGSGGLYLTDTLIRWEDSTCSIRETDVRNGSARIYALCTTNGQRRDRTFNLELADPDTLSLSFEAEGEAYDVSLSRCQNSQ